MEWTVLGATYEWSADWFQAWGSIGAIWFAGRFAFKDRLERRAEAMEAFDGIAGEVRRAISEAHREAEDLLVGGAMTVSWKDRFDDLEGMLKAVPVFDLGATQGAGAVAKMLFLVRSMRTLMGATSLYGSVLWIAGIRANADEAARLAKTITSWRGDRERRARHWYNPVAGL